MFENQPTLYIMDSSENVIEEHTDMEHIGAEIVRRIKHTYNNQDRGSAETTGLRTGIQDTLRSINERAPDKITPLRNQIMLQAREEGIPEDYLQDYTRLLEPKRIIQCDSRDPNAETIADVERNYKPGETPSESKRDRSSTSRIKRFDSIDKVIESNQ